MKKYLLILAAFLAAGIAGCKKDYLSLEVNPNAPSVTTPALTLAAALNNSAITVTTAYDTYGVWGGYWTTSGNYVPNQTINQYNITNTSANGTWTAWYANLANYNNLQVLASKDPTLSNYQAIAMIMKAYGFQMLVDQFNDVPYTQAFQPSTILFPAYDKGIDIYHDLGKQLDAAIALISKGGGVSPGTSDIVFGGNMTNWAKFANSLKLRLALRVYTKLGNGDPLVADLASTSSVGYLDASTEAYANPGYQNIAGKQSPFYGAYGFDANGNPAPNNVYYRANDFAVTTMQNLNDPRVSQIYSQVPTSSSNPTLRVRGNIFGDVSANLETNSYTSGMGPGIIKSSSQGAPLFLGSESLFLQAEAANDGIISGDARSLYEAGITASFEELGLTDAQATAYFSQNLANAGWAASPNKEQAIITQKWIALNGSNEFEGWNEFRRTGFPAVPSSIDPARVNPTTPYRVLYPLSELDTNPTNLGKEGTIDPFSSKIFWMP